MCHSSVIIRKHIDLTITLEQHSPAPQTGYLSPGGTWSDEAGSELILRLCFTHPAAFAPPLAPLFAFTSFFPVPLPYSLLISFSTSRSHSAFCPLHCCHLHSAAGKGQAHLLSQPRALQTRQQPGVSPLAFGCTPAGTA